MAGMAGVLKPIAEAVLDIGVATRNQCLAVLVGIVGILVELIIGIAALTPPITLAGILLTGGGLVALLKLTSDQFAAAAETQAAALKSTTARYGVWPRGGGEDKATAASMADGSVKDGDASWSRQ